MSNYRLILHKNSLNSKIYYFFLLPKKPIKIYMETKNMIKNIKNEENIRSEK